MTDLLPIVELLRDCETDRERAEWLFAVPLGVIQRDHMAIRALLQAAGFEAGVRCLDAEFATLNCRRMPDGSLPFFAIHTAQIARAGMADAVRSNPTGDLSDAT